jgi:cytolysin-activating lysine-acyltransferase
MDVAVERARAMNAAPDSTNLAQQAQDATATGKAPSDLRFSPGAQVVGEIVGLLTQSGAHRHPFLADLEWLVGPPLALRQFRIFRDDKKPLAVALWASVSDEVEKELIAGRTRLKPNEWKSGESLWLIDLIAPGISDGVQGKLVAELVQRVFLDRGLKLRVFDRASGVQKVVELGPDTTNKGLQGAFAVQGTTIK